MGKKMELLHEWEAEVSYQIRQADGTKGWFDTTISGNCRAYTFEGAEKAIVEEFAGRSCKFLTLKLTQHEPDGSGAWIREIDMVNKGPRVTLPNEALKRKWRERDVVPQADGAAAQAAVKEEEEVEKPKATSEGESPQKKKGRRKKIRPYNGEKFWWLGDCAGMGEISMAEMHPDEKEIAPFKARVKIQPTVEE